MMIFLPLRVTADAKGGLKGQAQMRPVLTGVWGRLATNKQAPGIYRGIACRYLRADICKKISITIIFIKNL